MKRGLRSALAGIGLAVIASFSIVGGLQYLLSSKMTNVLVRSRQSGVGFLPAFKRASAPPCGIAGGVTGNGSAAAAERGMRFS